MADSARRAAGHRILAIALSALLVGQSLGPAAYARPDAVPEAVLQEQVADERPEGPAEPPAGEGEVGDRTAPEDDPDGPDVADDDAAALLAALATAPLAALEPRAGTGDFAVAGGEEGVDYAFDGSVLHIMTSTPLTVSMAAGKTGTAHTIDIDAGVKADLTLAGVNISTAARSPINLVTNSDEDGDGVKVRNAADIVDKTTLHLTLADGSSNSLVNTVTGANGWPAIRCGWGSVLIVDDARTNVRAGGSKFDLSDIVTPADGKVAADVTLLDGTELKTDDPLTRLESSHPGTLTVQGGGHSAGIGSGPKENAGTMVFNGGIVSAKPLPFNSSNWSYANGSAIGGGSAGSGTVTIFNGGRITAQGGSCGTAIGAGFGYHDMTGHHGCTAKADAIVVPANKAENIYSYGYTFFDVPVRGSAFDGGALQSGGYNAYFTVAGDIYINGGFVNAVAAYHGNAIGQCCAHGPASNLNHIIKVTGGTVITSVGNKTSTNPTMYAVGAAQGYTIVTGGSVMVENRTDGTYSPMFQGIGDTAFNTQGVESWDDVEALGGSLPDTDKVQMLTINLSSEFDESENKTVPVTKWKLEVDNQVQAYGSPSYLNDGRLYLWLPATATGKNVTVTMSYLDNDGVEHDIEPMYVEEVGGSQGSTLKRYIDIDVDKLTDEQKEYFSGLQKAYDGLPFETLTVSDEKPIDTTPFETNGKLLTDPTKLEVSYQAYDGEGGSPLPGSSVIHDGKMPADTGTFRFQLISKQFAEQPGFMENYWGHRITGWSSVTPVPAVVKISEADGTAWVRLADDGSYELVKETDTEPGNRLRLAFTLRSAKGTAVTCKAPTGSFQVLIDGKPVGEAEPLTEEAMKASPGSSIAIKEGATDASANTPAAVAGESGRWETQVVYYLDPTRLDGALDVLDGSSGNSHDVTVRYIPDKNYVEGTEANPENEATRPTTIVPVKPEGTVSPDDPDKVEVEDGKDPDPGTPDPDNPTGRLQVVRKTVTVNYGDFHSEDAEVEDFFGLALTSTSSAPGSFSVSNGAVADLVCGEDGKPVLDDGRLQVRVNSCGTSTIVLEQGANALYTGIKYIITVNVRPDPGIVPHVQIRLTWRNLTASEGEGLAPVARLMVRALGAADSALPAPLASVGRAHTPPRPGDVIEYTVTGLNLTPGSAWQAAELTDAIDERLEFDNDSVQICPNYPTRTDKSTDLGSAAFYEGFDWDALTWSDVDPAHFTYQRPTLTKGVGTVYGGQSTSVRFRATVGIDKGLGDRPGDDGRLPEISNLPGGGGGYGKDEADLDPGEEAVPVVPLPEENVVVVGGGDPEPGKPSVPEPTPVLPKDPVAADILTTVEVGHVEHREEHDDDRILVGDVFRVTATSTNRAPDSKLANAVIKVTLPEGMRPKAGTIRLTDAGGTVYEVPNGAYDPETGIVAVNAGDLYGGESARLTFDVEVVSVSPDGSDPSAPPVTGSTLGETPTDEWEREHPDPDDPDGPQDPVPDPVPGTPFVPGAPWSDLEDELVSTPPASDPDMPPVLPASPRLPGDGAEADVRVTKTADNLSRDDGTTRVGDTVRYAVKVENVAEQTAWYDVVVADRLPVGLEPVAGSISLTGPDGVRRVVPDDAYDPATRRLAVTAGDLHGPAAATLVFDVTVTDGAVGADVGNVADAFGTTPADVDLDAVAPGAQRPAGGEPFVPSDGWDAWLAGRSPVSNPDPAYPDGVGASGGVLPSDDGVSGGAPGASTLPATGSGHPGTLLPATSDVASMVPALAGAATAGTLCLALVLRRRR